MRKLSVVVPLLGLLLLTCGTAQAGLVYALLDVGPSGQRVESVFYPDAIAVGTANEGDEGPLFPATWFTSETDDAFTVALDNVNTDGDDVGRIDWRDRGDSSNSGGSLVKFAEDFIKNGNGVIRVTLGSLPAGSYNVTSWHRDPDNSQCEAITVWLDEGSGSYDDTGAVGTALTDIGDEDDLTFANVEATKAEFGFTADGVHDVRIVFDGSEASDDEVPLNGLFLVRVPDGTLEAVASTDWHEPDTWYGEHLPYPPTVPTDVTDVIVEDFHVRVTTPDAVGGTLEVSEGLVDPGKVTITSNSALAITGGIAGDGTIVLQDGANLTTGMGGSIGTVQIRGNRRLARYAQHPQHLGGRLAERWRLGRRFQEDRPRDGQRRQRLHSPRLDDRGQPGHVGGAGDHPQRAAR